MPAKPICLGSMEFAKKGDAETYIRAMLSKYEIGDRVGANDAVVVAALLARHPEAEAKIGCGISHFSVRTADYGTRCFWVNRTDGTTEKFSFTTCIYS